LRAFCCAEPSIQIKNGSLPLSVVEWILLDDSSSLDQALK